MVEDPSHLALVTEFNKASRLPNGIQPIIVDDDLLNEKCDKFKHWLVGKFLTDCPINFGIAKRSLIKALRCRAQIPTVDLEQKFFFFQFQKNLDMKKVMANEPWQFNWQTLVVNRWDEELSASQISFSHCSFRIQLHDMPSLYMTELIGKL